jgi:CelD/BcsL family acetyltransferase involved in cellulose biosynthesis
MNIAIVTGDKAIEALDRPSIEADWNALYARCPWATGFQTFGYAAAWYRCYRDFYEPILVTATSGGEAVGVLPLARATESRRFVVAGGHQAEYQAWITEPAQSDAFIVTALDALRDRFPGFRLVMRYVPPGVPLGALVADGGREHCCRLSAFPRPLWGLAGEGAATFAEGGDTSKRKLKALAKLGTLEFKRVRSIEEFERLLPEIALYYDLRQGATHDILPFTTDTPKAGFHRALFRVPGLLHVTVLIAGGTLVSAQVAFCSRTRVHLGFWSQSPFMTRYSPGKLHLAMLGPLAKDEGWVAVDLTPGRDWYKERYATEHDEVYEIVAYPHRRAFTAARWGGATETAVRHALHLVHVDAADVKKIAARLQPSQALASALAGVRQTSRRDTCAVLWLENARARELAESGCAARDRVADCLQYTPAGAASRSRQDFLSACHDRFARGDHSVSACNDEGLEWCGWFGDRKAGAALGETPLPFTLPVDAIVCYDVLVPAGAISVRRDAWLKELIVTAARSSRAPRIYMAVPGDDAGCRRALETLGFTVEQVLARGTGSDRQGPHPERGGSGAGRTTE